MTVKRYWSAFKSYRLLSHKIRIDPLQIKQKEAFEKKEVHNDDDKENLKLALEDFKWVTGQETEKHLVKANPKVKVPDPKGI